MEGGIGKRGGVEVGIGKEGGVEGGMGKWEMWFACSLQNTKGVSEICSPLIEEIIWCNWS
jgi:hypothetical protein